VTRQRKCPYKRGNKIAKSLAPIMLWGPPGVGKSQMVIGVTQEMGLDIVDVRLAQKDPTDMRGLPVPDEKTKAVQWFLSSEWPRDWSSRGIIFFDELTAADKTLQVSAYEMILDRKLGDVGEGKFGYEVPPGWLIVAADADKAFTLINTYSQMAVAENEFNKAASNYGKQYSFPVPMSKAPTLDTTALNDQIAKGLTSGMKPGVANKKGGGGALVPGIPSF
jgi:hypothetical protein